MIRYIRHIDCGSRVIPPWVTKALVRKARRALRLQVARELAGLVWRLVVAGSIVVALVTLARLVLR